MKDPLYKSVDFTEEELIALVKDSMVGYIEIGKRVMGQALFYEKSNVRRPKHDIIFYWRALYVRCADEYDFAMKAFGDWGVYKRFCKSSSVYVKSFKPLWDEERELHMRSNAMKNIVNSIKDGNIQDSKWLEGHITKFNGKPTKVEKDKAKEALDKVLPDTADTLLTTIEDNYSKLN